jgi:predicted porin
VVANGGALHYWNGGMFLISPSPVSGIDTMWSGTWGAALGGGAVAGSGLSRANAISYTSPAFGGFSVAAAWGENDVWDVALRYAGEFSGFRVAAGIGYADNTGGFGDVVHDIPDNDGKPTPNFVKASASILHVASGLYLTGTYVEARDRLDASNNPASDTTLWYLQGGITKNWTGLGNTVIYGEYANIEDPLACSPNSDSSKSCLVYGGIDFADTITDSNATVWGVGIVQNIDAAAMELYLAYRRFTAEATFEGWTDDTLKYNDADVVYAGGRIKF